MGLVLVFAIEWSNHYISRVSRGQGSIYLTKMVSLTENYPYEYYYKPSYLKFIK